MENTKIYQRSLEKMCVVEYSELKTDWLLDFFLDHPYRGETVYVVKTTDKGKILAGIITKGDFYRHMREGKPLVNTSFTKIDVGQEDEAVEILQKKAMIWAAPIVDDEGCLIKEYYKQYKKDKNSDAGIDMEWFCRVYQEAAVLSDYEKIFFVVGNGVSVQTVEQYVKAHSDRMNPKIEIVKQLLTDELQTCRETVFVCDFDEEGYRVREFLYQEYGIKNVFWRLDEKDEGWVAHLKNRSCLFKKVALWDVPDKSLYQTLCTSHSVVMLEPEKVHYNRSENCYEYDEHISDVPECIIQSIAFDSKNTHILVNSGEVVPVVAVFIPHDNYNDNFQRYKITLSATVLAACTFPELRENGIKCIFFAEPENNWDALEDWFPEDDLVDRRKTFSWEKLKTNQAFVHFIAAGDKTQEETYELIAELFQADSCLFAGGYADVSGKYVNRQNGERYTCGNPQEYKNTVYLFGPCLVRGPFVEDCGTLASCMREKIPDSYYIKNCGSTYTNFSIVRKETYHSGDVVIFIVKNMPIFQRMGIKLHDFSDVYQKIPNVKETVWNNLMHVNKTAMKYIAQEIYEQCEQEGLFAEDDVCENQEVVFGDVVKKTEIPEQMEEWLGSVEQYKIKDAGCAGAIVMNCNPFTRGHRYLIEVASRQVDVLYIFVVEENKSFFDFKDRMEMVRIGVADLENVIVIPSGKYIISTVTLPGYFEKETRPFVEFDATEDLVLFSDVIAKWFDINIRFAGEEPKDEFTNHYNESMRKILPEHGVEFREIPRKSLGGDVISASQVRKYMKEKNMEEIRKRVLPEVYEYLCRHYLNGE